jgi:xylan 1,4-beta-xylosidase
MKRTSAIVFLILCLSHFKVMAQSDAPTVNTFCNPLDLRYRFGVEEPSRREAADPTIVWFEDRYFLFASKSGGYWHSLDLTDWTFVETDRIPAEEYAPSVVVIGNTMYFLASSNEQSTVYKSTNPLSGEWDIAVEKLEIPIWDPAFFLDEDERLYLYWGCSNENPLYGVEMDYKNNFAFLGKTKELLFPNPARFGWEVPGDYNTLVNQSPWIEGASLTKHDGKYYLQYSGPGTEYKSYADGVYVSDSPLGPFSPQPHNPFAYKPEGFAAGAGHGGSFTDKYGNFWHIGTITISQKQVFERRLGLFPVFYDDDGTTYAITKYGDYPLIMPQRKINRFEDIFPEWMLLTYGKKLIVSSSVDSLPAHNITDEDIRTYWAAESGNKNEFALIDMGELYDVYAIQINFAEHNTKIIGRERNLYHRYRIEYSIDGVNWHLLIDKSKNETDNTHNYKQLENAINCQYLKIINIEVPGGHFAISGFRAFGKGYGDLPDKISEFLAIRNQDDRRSVNLVWSKSKNATGYNISYGIEKDKLYHNYIVYEDTSLTINSLNSDLKYYFSIESFNENGITLSEKTILAE